MDANISTAAIAEKRAMSWLNQLGDQASPQIGAMPSSGKPRGGSSPMPPNTPDNALSALNSHKIVEPHFVSSPTQSPTQRSNYSGAPPPPGATAPLGPLSGGSHGTSVAPDDDNRSASQEHRSQTSFSDDHAQTPMLDNTHTERAAAELSHIMGDKLTEPTTLPGQADSESGRSMAKNIVMSDQLESLAARVPVAGETVAAIIRLMDICVAARPVAQNARELARLCLDVVDLIEDLVDFSGNVDECLFNDLSRAFHTAAQHVQLFAQPGWLVHLALMDDVRGQFQTLHQHVVDILKEGCPQHLLGDILGHQRRYTDPARPLCRVLRQLGTGKIVDGLYTAQKDNVYDKDIVHALTPPSVAGVDRAAVRRELRALPPRSKGLDLNVLYRSGAPGQLSQLEAGLGSHAVRGLRRLYDAFASYGQRYAGATGLDGVRFMKLAQDCGLVGKGRKLKQSDIDIVFAKVRSKGERVITFEQFVAALDELGTRSQSSGATIAKQCLESHGPITRATLADNVRFYDDKSTYTGTWAHGGGPPTNYDGPKDLASQLSRGIRADQRRINVEAAAAAAAAGLPAAPGASTPHRRDNASGPAAAAIAPTPRTRAQNACGNSEDALRAKFIAFAVFGKGASVVGDAERQPEAVAMDSKGFAKLCKESDVMGGRLGLTRVDLCFTKACDKALAACAEVRGVDADVLMDAVANGSGPVVRGTHAEAVRLHEMKISTGARRRGKVDVREPEFTRDGRPIWQDT